MVFVMTCRRTRTTRPRHRGEMSGLPQPNEAKRSNTSKNQNGHQERRKNKRIDKVQCDGRLWVNARIGRAALLFVVLLISFCLGRRKTVINRENESRARWPERWGFYSKDNVETLWSKQAVEFGLPENFIELRRQKLRKQDRIQPLVNVVPSPNPVPVTSSGFVGWRSSLGICNLEMFGRFFAYNRLDTRMLKSDNEPDQKQQRFIILG